MINKIGHYSLENPGTIYDEEAMTALELAGRTASKVNECVDQVNQNTEALPDMVARDVQKHINEGAFDAQIDAYAGELEDHINEVDQKHTTNLDNEVNTLDKRIDNIVSHPGNGTVPTEVVDARLDDAGTTHGSLATSVKEQARQVANHFSEIIYLGGKASVDVTENDDGSVDVHIGGRPSFYGMYKSGIVGWSGKLDNIAQYTTIHTESGGVIYEVTINVPKYMTLVYNRVDQLYYMRNLTNITAHDVVMVANTWGNPIKGNMMDEWKHRHILSAEKNIYVVRGAYLYGGDTFKMEFVRDEETPALEVTMYGRPTVCYGSETYQALWDGDYIEDIKDKLVYPRGEDNHIVATIKIPGWNALVFNHLDKRWHFRYRANLKEGDILALATGYCQPLCGTLLEEWSAKKNMELEKYLGTEAMSYNPPAGVTEFSGLINKAQKVEKFMWFTDPHLCEGTEWQTEFETYKNQLKACFDATPATFAVCGGDWLGNSDTQAGACFKLGYIGAQMRSIFRDKYFPVVGNHDTNYQGTTVEGGEPRTGRLDPQTIANVWNNPTYYTFDGDSTRFFVFDSELDWDLSITQYKAEQLVWFCQQLKNNEAENMAGVIHIYYSLDEENGTGNHSGEMGKKITEIANAYNNRGTITFNGATFDYSQATGKFRFVLAGHNHGDALTTEDGIPVVLTTKTRQDGTPTFDLCLVNYDTNKLHLCRVGSGESRTVNI